MFELLREKVAVGLFCVFYAVIRWNFAMAEKDVTHFTKFDGSNFEIWQFGVTFLLEAEDVIEHVQKEFPEPDKTKQATKWSTWKSGRAKAAVIILKSVEQSLHLHLSNCKSPKQMWDRLSLLYGKVGDDVKQDLWQRFYDFRFVNGTPMSHQMVQFETITKKLESMKEKVTDTMIITKLLNALPAHLSNFRMAWESTPAEERKKDNLITRLIREDKRLS